jgi:hypothetical protein
MEHAAVLGAELEADGLQPGLPLLALAVAERAGLIVDPVTGRIEGLGEEWEGLGSMTGPATVPNGVGG